MSERNWVSQKQGDEINVVWTEAGQSIEGFYVKKSENCGTKQDSNIFSLKTEKGESLSFWGTKVLDDQMEKVDFGSYVKIDYLGKLKAKTGGMSYHAFEVFVDASTAGVTQAVSTQAPATTKAADNPVASKQAPKAAAVSDDPFGDEEDIF